MKTLAALTLALATLAPGCARMKTRAVAPRDVAVSQTAVSGDEGGACGSARMEMHFFHGEHGVERRVIDRHRCGVVELRVVDRLDADTDTHVREILRDLDHDGSFERRVVQENALAGSFARLARSRTRG